MRRRTILIAVVACSAIAAVTVAIGRFFNSTGPATATQADLAAPLPAEADADFAAALPAIDELRNGRDSVLHGTLLDDVPASAAADDDSYIDLLRSEARRLDDLAADHEQERDFRKADEMRSEAGRLRDQARKLDKEMTRSRNTFYLDYERR